MMEEKFAVAMVMAVLTLLFCASKKTMPLAIITGAISVYLCCDIIPDVAAAAGR